MEINLDTLLGRTPVTKETANLPSSPVTKLACYLLTIGLYKLANGTGQKTAQAFVTQFVNLQNYNRLVKDYGIKSTWLSENPKITDGFLPSIKTAISRKIANDPDVTSQELTFVKFAILFAATPDKADNYVDRARKYATAVSAAFVRNFDKVVERLRESGGTVKTTKRNIEDVYDELDAVMQSILGRKLKRDENSIPTDVLKNAALKSTAKADMVKNYKALKRQLASAYDVDLTTFLANQKDLISVSEVYKHMKKLGYRDHKVLAAEKSLPIKVGMVNGKFRYYTDSGKILAANIPSNAIDIKMARTYDDKTGKGAYLSYTSPGAIGTTRVYTEMHNSAATESKFTKAAEVDSSINTVLSRWKKDLTSTDIMTQMAATACMLVYLTGMRVGSRQNSAASASGEKTFGAISLRPAHVRLSAASIILDYKGKKGVSQKHVIKLTDTTTKRVAQNLKKYLEGKRGDTLVFSQKTPGRGADKVLTYGRLTQYLSASGYPAGIHKIRHVRGTNLLIEAMQKEKWKPSAKAMTNLTRRQKEAEEFIIDKIISPVTTLLGHKSGDGKLLWRTTVKSYINPAPLIQWFNDHDLRRPNWLPAKVTAE